MLKKIVFFNLMELLITMVLNVYKNNKPNMYHILVSFSE